jgi:ABC-type multidrug transport system ATPase subunit
MTESSVVRAHGLSFSYGRHQALRDLTLEIGAGATFLAGVNGAGKTTFFKLLLGQLAPSSGTLTVLGQDVASRRGRREVRWRAGSLPQQFGIAPRLTVTDFVSYLGHLRGIRTLALEAAVPTAIDRVGLSAQAHVPLGQLSGGMLRRAGVAQALVAQPDLLLLDEPTAGLDPAQRLDLRDLIRELAHDIAVVVSTHLLEDVRVAADQLVVIHDGSVRFAGSPAELADGDPNADLELAFLRVTGTLISSEAAQ